MRAVAFCGAMPSAKIQTMKHSRLGEHSPGSVGSEYLEPKWLRIILGPFWSVKGLSSGPLEPSGGAIGQALEAVLGRRMMKTARTLKSFNFVWAVNVLCLLQVLLGVHLWPSLDVLGASWAVLKPSWAVLERS